MGFSRPEYWSGLSCPPPGDLPNLGKEPRPPTLQADSLPPEPSGKKTYYYYRMIIYIMKLVLCGEGNGNPLQYSCLENSMDGEAWWATVHGIANSWTWLSNFTGSLITYCYQAVQLKKVSCIIMQPPEKNHRWGNLGSESLETCPRFSN